MGMDSNLSLNANAPVWNSNRPKGKEKFQEVWFVKLNDPDGTRALWLRFTLLVTKNGFQRIAETWAVFLQREPGKEITKSAVKQSFGIASFSSFPAGIKIESCTLGTDHTQGQIQSKGKSIRWDLAINNLQPHSVNFLPQAARKIGLFPTLISTISEEMLFSGTVTVDGVVHEFKNAPGCKSHWSGERSADSWVWGQANVFKNDQGEPSPFIFEGITARPRWGGNLKGPKLSSFYFFYKEQHYLFDSAWDAFQLKSDSSITEWRFQADRADISFRGSAKADHKDFAGVTLEDTDGSVLYCANSTLSNLQILVYRRGKLETTVTAVGTAAFEVVSRTKNPYIQELI
jgi:hypothetical protein